MVTVNRSGKTGKQVEVKNFRNKFWEKSGIHFALFRFPAGNTGKGKRNRPKTGVFPGKDRETILGDFGIFEWEKPGNKAKLFAKKFIVGKIGKRHGFSKGVTVNRSGKTGKQIR